MTLKSALLTNFVTPSLKLVNIDPNYIYNEFEFNERTPLSSIVYPTATVIIYCIFIPFLQSYMENRKTPNLKYILIFHNLFLSLISGFIFLLILAQLSEYRHSDNYKYSYFTIYCGLTYHDQRGLMTFIYYINHLLKYYELIDTIFLCLKKKKIGFLHAYHHPATLVLTWVQIYDSTGVQWVVIFLNLFVHFIMYFYYFLASLKIRFPFPKIVTILQILQFILDLIACYVAWYYVALDGGCYGHLRSGFSGCFILTSYLYLFVDFYVERYGNAKRKQLKAEKKKEIIKKIE